MRLSAYLPSTHFLTVAGSIGLAGGLILGAQYLTAPNATPAVIATDQTAATNQDWRAALDAVQATAPQLPEAPSTETVQQLLDGAKSSNLTDTVARSLLINLTNAGSQGLGNDIPTQDKLIEEAIRQVPSVPAKTYANIDLAMVEDTPTALRAYGNKVMEAFGRHTGATSQATLLAMSLATDNNDPEELAALAGIQAQYAALARDLADIPVPKTLSPLHLQALNDIAVIAASFDDMQTVLKDPLRGLGGFQHYQSALGEAGRVFTSIAEILLKNGILFSKDEPGAPWSVFVSPYSQ